jgi:hypothetical protein
MLKQVVRIDTTDQVLTHAYLGSNAVAIPEQLMSTASLVRFVIVSTYCINKGILCPRSNDDHHISEEDLNSLNTHVKTYYCVDCKEEGRQLPEQSESYLIYYCLVPSTF